MAILIALLIALSQTFGWTPAAPAAMTQAVETFGEGTWLVPDDIRPGTYRAANTVLGCYWERLSGLSGESDDRITNDYVGGHGPAIVTIKKTDAAFTSHDCGEWKRVQRS